MTKSELKEIIKECIMEMNTNFVEESVDINSVNEDSYVMESDEYDAYCIAEARAYIEAFIEQEDVLTEADTFTNMGTLHKALKDAKESTKDAKSLIKDGKNKEAKKKLDDAIKALKKAKDEINSDNSLGISILTSIIYLFAPFANVAFEIYARAMGTKESDERTATIASRITAAGLIRVLGNSPVVSALGITSIVTAIIALIKQSESIRNNNQDRNSGVIETKSIMLIDNYIKMLEKLKSNLK